MFNRKLCIQSQWEIRLRTLTQTVFHSLEALTNEWHFAGDVQFIDYFVFIVNEMFLHFVVDSPIDKSIVGLGNGLVPSGNKPLPELRLSDTFCRMTTRP